MSGVREAAPNSEALHASSDRIFRARYLLPLAALLAVLAYSLGYATGFVSDDYGWLRHGVRGELGWDSSLQFSGHSNALPLEIALYHLKFALFGFNPTAYHLFSVAGHVGNVFLLWALARRFGLSVVIASLAAVMAAVMAAGSQAVYWMSGDPHVWATLATLGAIILYIDFRERGGWWRYCAAIVLAMAAPLIKAEGVAVVGGVIAYELLIHRPASPNWLVAPFVVTPVPFILWELTTADQLRSQRNFGLNVVYSAMDYVRQIVLPLDPFRFLSGAEGLLHHPLRSMVGMGLYLEAAALALLLISGLVGRQSVAALVIGIVGTAPALVVTLGTQSRYDYLAGLFAALIAANGAWRLFSWARVRFTSPWLAPAAVAAIGAIVGVQMWITVQGSSDLRAAYAESIALRTAVLSDHPSVPEGAPICIIDSPLDTGSATAVFADPRLDPLVGIPVVTRCASAADVSAGQWAYVRQPDGRYAKAA